MNVDKVRNRLESKLIETKIAEVYIEIQLERS